MKRLAGMVGMGVLLLMVGVTGTNMLLRPFGYPISGSADLTSLFCALLTALAVVFCEIKNSHTVVDILVRQFSPRLTHRLRRGGVICCILLFVILFATALQWAVEKGARGERSETLHIPLTPFVATVPASFLGMAILMMKKLISEARRNEKNG